MSNPSTFPGSDGPFVDVGDLGDRASDDVEVPTVDERAVVLDDDDAGECRYAYPEELRDAYVDNPTNVSSVQHDVWTLRIDDDDEFEFEYANGATARIRWGDIDPDGGPGPDRYRRIARIVYPTNEYGTPRYNATATPRLAAFKRWVLEQLGQRAEQRLEIAEIVNAFASIISLYSGPLDQ